MASSDLVPANGAVTVGSFTADFASMRLRASQGVAEVTPYGANTCAKRRGTGTPMVDVTVGGFQLKGASNTKPPILSFSSAGDSCTFTLDDSCTVSGNFVKSDYEVIHARMQAAVAFTMNLANADDVTVAWVET